MEIEINILEAGSIFSLSLWKTYVGPALGAGFYMCYFEYVAYTLSGAAVTVFTTLYFAADLTRYSKRALASITGRLTQQSPKFNPGLRKALRFYKRYVSWGLMALTPILIGLPVGVSLYAVEKM